MGNRILMRRKDGMAEIILNNPPQNMLDLEMITELVEALDKLRDDETLKVLVIKGANNHFCSGVDPKERGSDRAGLFLPEYTRAFDFINEINGVTLCVIEGEAVDAGFELASFCDVIFATDDAIFRHPEIEMALFPPISAVTLPRLIGRNKAIEWIITGKTIKAIEGYEAGLVNRILKKHNMIQEIDEFIAKLETLSASGIMWAKRAIDKSLYSPVMEGMRISESIYSIEVMNSIDVHEGIKAKIEKRPPKWRHR